MRKINKIILHCSDSTFGSKDEIDQWHKSRGWSGIGYHYVICNGVLTSKSKYVKIFDGLVQNGRPITEQGAHCLGQNEDSIGICLIGKADFTVTQFISLAKVLKYLMKSFNIPIENIHGHNEFDKGKTCPVFSVKEFKKKHMRK